MTSNEFPVDNMAEPVFGVQMGPGVLRGVHSPEKCAGRPCIIHAPLDNHMSTWPLNWRGDTRVMERICEHGVGHPCLEDVLWNASEGRAWVGTHGCDSCCVSPETT